MSDNEVRKILIERKRQDEKMKRRKAAVELAGDVVGWGSLIVICFMLLVIGG